MSLLPYERAKSVSRALYQERLDGAPQQCHRTLHHFYLVYFSFFTTGLTRSLPSAPLERVVFFAITTAPTTTNNLIALVDQTAKYRRRHTRQAH